VATPSTDRKTRPAVPPQRPCKTTANALPTPRRDFRNFEGARLTAHAIPLTSILNPENPHLDAGIPIYRDELEVWKSQSGTTQARTYTAFRGQSYKFCTRSRP